MARLPHPPSDATFRGKLSASARRFLEQQEGATSAPELKAPTAPSSAPASLPPAPASSRAARPARNLEHDTYQRDLRWLDRRRRQLADDPRAPKAFTVIPRDVWRLTTACMGSRRATFLELGRVRNRAAIGALRSAAFAGGARGWSSSYAHRVLVLGIAFTALCKPSQRKGRFRYVLEGIPREALCALLRDPHSDHTPSVSALRGRHRDWGTVENGQIGYLDALEAVGFLTRVQRQRPPDFAPSCNQYWIVGHSAYLFGEALERSLRFIEEADDIARPLARGSPSSLHN